ncbi:TRASH domain protein [Thiovibrio sp. JS02]
MNPLRILILGFLLYVLYRLLTGAKKIRRSGPAPSPPGKGCGQEPACHDVLVQDPVCRIYVPKGQAVMLQSDDKTVYFCSDKCREVFLGQKGEHR